MWAPKKSAELPLPAQALPGRSEAMVIENRHFVLGTVLQPPFPEGMHEIVFGLGCFWGAERKFWTQAGVYSTSAGYAGGFTPHPNYREVCGGMTGHNEVVRVIYDPAKISVQSLLKVFWESHDPTQGMRQGNDAGTQYRSGIYHTRPEQSFAAETSRASYQQRLQSVGFSAVTTEVKALTEFYYAEDYHQQYLAKNPGGYCGIGGTGVSCQIGLGA